MVECVNVAEGDDGPSAVSKWHEGGVCVSKTAKFSILNNKAPLRTTSLDGFWLNEMASRKKGE